MQVHKVGLENILRDVVDVCVVRKYAEKSMRKMQGKARDPITLAKSLVQLAAVCSAGLPFCRATYNLEGDGFLAPIAHSILHGLTQNIERGVPLDGLELAATRAEEVMKPAHDVELLRVSTLEVELVRAQVQYYCNIYYFYKQLFYEFCITLFEYRKLPLWHSPNLMPHYWRLLVPVISRDELSAQPPPGFLTKETCLWAAVRTPGKL